MMDDRLMHIEKRVEFCKCNRHNLRIQENSQTPNRVNDNKTEAISATEERKLFCINSSIGQGGTERIRCSILLERRILLGIE
jgi:hypothetical protein